jgi:hypothetical protein
VGVAAGGVVTSAAQRVCICAISAARVALTGCIQVEQAATAAGPAALAAAHSQSTVEHDAACKTHEQGVAQVPSPCRRSI